MGKSEELKQWNAKSVPHPGFFARPRAKKCAMMIDLALAEKKYVPPP
jgi:hypothetical protein